MKSREKTFVITCPECKHKFEKILPTALFASGDEKEDIFKDGFAKTTCPACGNEFTINYRFAYTDEINRFMIVNDPAFVDKKARLAFSTSLGLVDRIRKNELYKHKLRISYSHDMLREKIIILSQGLDDKVVELMKVFLLESEDFAYDAKDIKTFIFKADKSFYLETTLNVGLRLDFSDFLYDTIKENYKEKLAKDLSYLVDRAWAVDFLSKD